MRAASGFEPRTKRLETRALVGSATREASYEKVITQRRLDYYAKWPKTQILGLDKQFYNPQILTKIN